MKLLSERLVIIINLLLCTIGIAAFSFAAASAEESCTVGADGSQECRDAASITDDAAAEETKGISSQDVVPSVDDNTNEEIIDDDDEDCKDTHENCALWESLGECSKNPNYMLTECARSCKSCKRRRYDERTAQYGERQLIQDEATAARIQEMHSYMTDTVYVNETYAKVKAECKNRHKDCAFWAVSGIEEGGGECSKNPAYMNVQCAPACFTCHLLDFDTRCPFDRDAPKFLNEPGDLDRFFENLLEKSTTGDDKNNYNPTIFSGPAKYTSKATSTIDEATEKGSLTVSENAIVDGPWVVLLENVLSDEECDHLIQLGHSRGYERSKDVGTQKFDGTFDSYMSPSRTSTNAWCSEECFDDTKVQELTARIEDLTGIPSNHSEYWQLLRYEVGQQYKRHHDYIDHQLDRAEGVRILTVFFYLNTVEAGGGTRFPVLDLTVQPVRGSCLIWPSVLNEDPDAKDPRTDHQALPVDEGIKFGANAWVHQRDYKTPHLQGCQ